jgi:hypothetical protein
MYPEKPLILYGIELDVTLYRACLVNLALFSTHPYSIICADALMLNDTMQAWNQGNLWNPPDMSQYYWSGAREPAPSHSLSFEELMKRKQERLQAEKELNLESPPEVPQIAIKSPSRPIFSLENYVKSRNKK